MLKIPRVGVFWILLIPPLLWASNAVVGRLAVHEIPPLALSFWRWVVAFVLVLPFTGRAVWQQRHLIYAHPVRMLVLAASGVAAYNSLQYLALTTSPVVNASLIGAAFPLVMLPLAIGFLGERTTPLALLGMVLALMGVMLVLTQGSFQRLLELEFARGDLIMLLAVLSWALYTLMLRKYPLPMTILQSLTLQMALAIPLILPFYLWEYAHQGGFVLHQNNTLALLYVAIFPSLIAYTLWDKGVQAIGAAKSGIFINLIPVFAAIMAVIFLNEHFQWFHAAALVLMLMGVWLVNRKTA